MVIASPQETSTSQVYPPTMHHLEGGENMAVRVFRIESEQTKGKIYTIRETASGLRCNCPHFIFNDKEPCKHIKKLQDKIRIK